MRPATPRELIDAIATLLVGTNVRSPAAITELAGRFHGLARELAAQAESQDAVDGASRCAGILEKIVSQNSRAEAVQQAFREVTVEVEKLQVSLGATDESSGSHASVVVSAPLPTASVPPVSGMADRAQEAPTVWDPDTLAVIGDFLQETTENLTRADEILVAGESGTIDTEGINTLFRVFHTIKGVSGFLTLQEVTRLAHTTETLLDSVRDKQIVLEGDVIDVVLAAIDAMRQLMTNVQEAVATRSAVVAFPGLDELLARLEEPVTSLAHAGSEPLRVATARDVLPTKAASTTAPQPVASLPPVTDPAPQPNLGKPLLHDTVKVDVAHIDALVEMIGELVIAESMVVQAPEIVRCASSRLRTSLSQLAKITRDMQDIGMRMRMVPMRATFQKMVRIVRDLARKLGKEVQLELTGESTELDRSLVERLSEPLLHMIRNALDHGIESRDERLRAGKPTAGRLRLAAYHESGKVVIEIEDDGRGLDKDRLLAKARERGLVSVTEEIPDSDVYGFIFHPGFSTAEKVTEISGRGVGMDVVQRSIEALHGRVGITTQFGKGTTFRIVLPLTLAIIDGMLVACGSERYIIPTLAVVESYKPTSSAVRSYAGQGEIIDLRGSILPLVRLAGLLDINGAVTEPCDANVVVLETSHGKLGLLVDEVVSRQQVVIKSIESTIGDSPTISGAAILPDGRVGLILDVDSLYNKDGSLHVRSGWGDATNNAEPRASSAMELV